jgi:Oligosaccharyltransferase subunit Ribophorin II
MCYKPSNQCSTLTMAKAQKDLPVQLLTSSQPLRATLLLASFGSSQAFSNHVFNLDVKLDPSAPLPKYEKPLRYGKLEEIHHIFRADPKSGPKIVSLFFVLAVLATVPVLLGAVSAKFQLNSALLLIRESGLTLEPTSTTSQRP